MHRCMHCGRFMNPEVGCNACMEVMMTMASGLLFLAIMTEFIRDPEAMRRIRKRVTENAGLNVS